MSTKSPKSDKQYVWEGEANASSYTIREETDPEKLIPRGTRLTLYLKVFNYTKFFGYFLLVLAYLEASKFLRIILDFFFSVMTKVLHIRSAFRSLLKIIHSLSRSQYTPGRRKDSPKR